MTGDVRRWWVEMTHEQVPVGERECGVWTRRRGDTRRRNMGYSVSEWSDGSLRPNLTTSVGVLDRVRSVSCT